MPTIKYIHPAPSPTRRFPKSVHMSTVEPSPYRHKGCGKVAILYADGVIWCNECGHKVSADDCINFHRNLKGKVVVKDPVWSVIKV